MKSPTRDELVAALDASVMRPDDDGKVIALALYRTLAEGRPVPPQELARRLAVPEAEVREVLDAWPGVFFEDDAVVGFWGLALGEMDHAFLVDGRRLHTWCAWDPLFIAPILGTEAEVRSACPVTGDPVTLTVGPEGVRDLSPPEAVVSFVVPDETFGDDVLVRFCHFVWYFASEEAGRSWVAEHPGTLLLSVDEAFELGRRVGPLPDA